MDAKTVLNAHDLAQRAHHGQTDKAGAPYILHVSRVAESVRHLGPVYEAVAWLHDVLEDCPPFVDEFWTFPAEVTRRVSTLTRIMGLDSTMYYVRIKRDPVALAVKLADIADNSDEGRLSKLDAETAARLRRKYARAMRELS